MWWSGPMWGWGMPWGMFFMPIFFILAMVCMFYFFRHGFPFGGCHSQNNVALADEVRKLRQEVEELRKEMKK